MKVSLAVAALLSLLAAPLRSAPLAIPDVALFDQNGKSVRFYSDLVKGKIVAMNFVFTSCTTICAPMGANFGALQAKLGDRKDVALISVSIDPSMDTPERLKHWSARFNARPGWTLVTGSKTDVDRLLKALGVYTADRFSHSPIVLIGNDATGKWERANGLAPAAKLYDMIEAARTMRNAGGPGAGVAAAAPAALVRLAPQEPPGAAPPAAPGDAARRYFTDVQLVNQNGETMRLYSDLLAGRIVVINTFFATCEGSCPVTSGKLAEIQKHLGNRVGKDITMISITVDPETDTPAKLKAYAKRMKARPGWYFLTGTKENVDFALRKIGQYVDDKADHLNVIIIGNGRTGLWKKAFSLAPAAQLIPVIDSVVNDKG